MYSGHGIHTRGKVNLKCSRKGKTFDIEFLIVPQDLDTILGCETSQKCGFLKVIENDYIRLENQRNVYHVNVEEEF